MKRKIKKLFSLLLGTGLIYLLLLIYPNFLFANKYQYQGFQVYSDRPIPESIRFVIDDAICRLEHSELYDSQRTFRLYLCNENWRFKFFVRNGYAGGVVNFLISPNIFIRASNIEENKLIPPAGWMYTPQERPLSYFIAHEAVHSLQRTLNPFLQLMTPAYILEGYADYIGKRPDFDYDKYKVLYLNRDFVMNPENGLYHKYHLYTSYLIDKKGYSFKDILEEKPALEETLREAVKD